MARIFEFPYFHRAYCDRDISEYERQRRQSRRDERLLEEARRRARQQERARFFDGNGPEAA